MRIPKECDDEREKQLGSNDFECPRVSGGIGSPKPSYENGKWNFSRTSNLFLLFLIHTVMASHYGSSGLPTFTVMESMWCSDKSALLVPPRQLIGVATSVVSSFSVRK